MEVTLIFLLRIAEDTDEGRQYLILVEMSILELMHLLLIQLLQIKRSQLYWFLQNEKKCNQVRL